MELFIGEFNGRKLDEKYRVSVPSKFKKLFQKHTQRGLIIRQGRNNCLILSSIEEYEQIPKDIRDTIKADNVTLDKKNRMSIPQQFRSMFEIGKEISFKGSDTHVELRS